MLILSGVGWENRGCSIAHGLVEALSTVEDTKGISHGEGVAFSLLVQLIMDREDRQMFDRIYRFCRTLELPVCLKDLGIVCDVKQKVKKIADTAFGSASKGTLNIRNYAADRETMYNAILYLDALTEQE